MLSRFIHSNLAKPPLRVSRVGQPLKTEDVVDALVYDTGNDPEDPALLTLLLDRRTHVDEDGPMSGTTVSMSRVPNGGEARRTSTYVLQTPSPGASNVPTESLNLQFEVPSINEVGGRRCHDGNSYA